MGDDMKPDFVVADTHFFHRNIVQYQDRPMEHNDIMLKRWRTTVKPSHSILHLGDLFFGRKGGCERFTTEIAPYLTGKKYIILGNHDRRDFDYESVGFTVLHAYSIEYKGYAVSFDHYPRLIHDEMKRIHIHGHLHRNGYSPNGEPTRPNNINVSVEVIDYKPRRFNRLVDAAILARKERKPFYNSKGYRAAQVDRQRRAAHEPHQRTRADPGGSLAR